MSEDVISDLAWLVREDWRYEDTTVTPVCVVNLSIRLYDQDEEPAA